jgi:hypothetical protein
VQLLHGGGDVGAALCAAPDVGVISFTGSVASGAAVGPHGRSEAARAGARRQRSDDRLRGRRHRPGRHGVPPHRLHQLRAELHLGAARPTCTGPASTSS